MEYQGIQRNTQEYAGIPRNTRNTKEYKEYQGIPRNTTEYQGILRNTKEYRGIQGIPRNTKEHQGIQGILDIAFRFPSGQLPAASGSQGNRNNNFSTIQNKRAMPSAFLPDSFRQLLVAIENEHVQNKAGMSFPITSGYLPVASGVAAILIVFWQIYSSWFQDSYRRVNLYAPSHLGHVGDVNNTVG